MFEKLFAEIVNAKKGRSFFKAPNCIQNSNGCLGLIYYSKRAFEEHFFVLADHGSTLRWGTQIESVGWRYGGGSSDWKLNAPQPYYSVDT